MRTTTCSGRSPAELSDAIGQLYALSSAALGVMLEAVAAYDATEAWRADGSGSLGHWISYALGVTTTTGAAYARVARALAGLPLVAAALGSGRLGYEQVRALTRAPAGSDEASLVAEATGRTATQVEAMVRAMRDVGVEEARQANATRSLRLRWGTDDRMLRLTGRFPDADGAVIASVIESIAEQSLATVDDPEREAWDARCADALVELCSCAGGVDASGGAGSGGNGHEARGAGAGHADAEAETAVQAGGVPTVVTGCGVEGDRDAGLTEATVTDNPDDERHPVLGCVQIECVRGSLRHATASDEVTAVAPESATGAALPLISDATAAGAVDGGTAAAAAGNGAGTVATGTVPPSATAKQVGRTEAEAVRAQIVVHVEAGVLASGGEGTAALECGPPVSSETVRRLACDGWIQAVVEGQGRPLGVGRRRRTVPRSLLHVLRHRDGGCRFPGCTRTRWVHAHHVRFWADGGSTDLNNLLLLCGAHHRFVHEGGWRIKGDPGGEVRFVDPTGRELRVGPPALRPEVADRFGFGAGAGIRGGGWRPPWVDPGMDGGGSRTEGQHESGVHPGQGPAG